MNELNIVKKLPISLQNVFWSAFINAIEDEIKLFNQVASDRRKILDINLMDKERLLEVLQLFNSNFSADVIPEILNSQSSSFTEDELSIIREEVRSIFFKIIYRNTPLLFKSFFGAIRRLGGVYIYQFLSRDNALHKLLNVSSNSFSLNNLLLNANAETYQKPVFLPSLDDFTGITTEDLTLDASPVLQLDALTSWRLDTINTNNTTNHIALEVFIDRLVASNNPYTQYTPSYSPTLIAGGNIDNLRRDGSSFCSDGTYLYNIKEDGISIFNVDTGTHIVLEGRVNNRYSVNNSELTTHGTSGAWVNSNGTKLVVLIDRRIVTLNIADLTTNAPIQPISANTFDTTNSSNSCGIWSDETTVWVADWTAKKAYAYALAGGSRDTTKDITLETTSGETYSVSTSPFSLWGDGDTLWVIDTFSFIARAYNLTTFSRDITRDYRQESPRGLKHVMGVSNANRKELWIISVESFGSDNLPALTAVRDIDRYTTAMQSGRFLMTSELLDYIKAEADKTRKISDVIHVGSQLNVIVDSTEKAYAPYGYAPSPLSTDTDLFLGSAELRAVYTGNNTDSSNNTIPLNTFLSFDDILNRLVFIQFGTGVRPVSLRVADSITNPTSLRSPIYERRINISDKHVIARNNSTEYVAVSAEYEGQSYNKLPAVRVNYNAPLYSGNVFRVALHGTVPIKRGSLVINYLDGNRGRNIELRDDGLGELVSDYARGTINYETSEFTISDTFTFHGERTITNPTLLNDILEYSYIVDGTSTESISSSHPIEIIYKVKNSRNETNVYTATTTDGINFSTNEPDTLNPNDNTVWRTFNTRSRINLSTRVFNARFSVENTVNGITDTKTIESVLIKFTIANRIVSIPARLANPVRVIVDEEVRITEAGLFNNKGEMIAYATFLPISFKSSDYHLTFGFIIKNGRFVASP